MNVTIQAGFSVVGSRNVVVFGGKEGGGEKGKGKGRKRGSEVCYLFIWFDERWDGKALTDGGLGEYWWWWWWWWRGGGGEEEG